MKRILFISLLSVFFSINLFSQGDLCDVSEPFCTGDQYTFPAGVNSGQGQPGPNYGCLGSQPNPAWYHMKIALSGDINIFMSTVPLEDIDFICWGPFDDPIEPCVTELTSNKIVDCSYSPNPTENCYIPNGQVGEYYILLITNYSNSPCDISFSKTWGSGETDCTIVPPPLGSNSPLCYGDNLELWAGDYTNATYEWTGPSGFYSTLQNPVIFNVGLDNSGEYQLIITVNGSPSDPVFTYVSITAKPNPDFDFNDACFGDSTYFTDMSTVSPPTSQIISWKWEFGDGQIDFGENVTHLYAASNTYEVTLTTYAALFGCTRTETKTVTVYDAANVEAGEDQSIPNGWTVQLDGTVSGGSGDYNILWTPENLLSDPTIEDPETNPLGVTQVFKLTVTDAQSQCVNSDSTTVIVTGGPLSVMATASPMVICQGELIHLSANPSGGSGDNTYTWTSSPAGFTADIKEPSDFPDVTTTYFVDVFDGQTTVQAEITVQVKPKPIGNAGDDKTITVGTTTQINGAAASAGSGSYNYSWNPSALLEDASVLHPLTNILNEAAEFTLIVNDLNGCNSEPDKMWVLTGGDGLSTTPTASPDVVCKNESTTLHANPNGGGGEDTYIYYWYDGNGFESTEENPLVSPTETTIYTCELNDGFKIVSNTIEVTVNPLPLVDLLPNGYEYYGTDTIKACVRDTVTLDAGNTANPPNMNYLWSNTATSQKLNVITNGSWIDFQTYNVSVQNPVSMCLETGKMTVFFDFNECQIGVEETGALSENISISPNPSNGKFSIEIKGLEGEIDIVIDDIRGKNILNEKNIKINSNQFQKLIDISSFPSGIYLMSISHELGIFNSRIIKQ